MFPYYFRPFFCRFFLCWIGWIGWILHFSLVFIATPGPLAAALEDGIQLAHWGDALCVFPGIFFQHHSFFLKWTTLSCSLKVQKKLFRSLKIMIFLGFKHMYRSNMWGLDQQNWIWPAKNELWIIIVMAAYKSTNRFRYFSRYPFPSKVQRMS